MTGISPAVQPRFTRHPRAMDKAQDLQTASSATVDEEDWEDLPVPEFKQTPSRATSMPSSPGPAHSSTRRRKPGTKTIYIAQPGPVRKLPSTKAPKQAPPVIDREQLQHAVHAGASFTGAYVLNIVSTALYLLSKPLALLLVLYVLAFIFGRLTNTLRTIYAPLCVVPGFSLSPLCYVPEPGAGRPQGQDFQRLMNVQGSTFEQLLDDSTSGKGLSLGMKKAEMATRDLIIVVRNSGFKSKDMLVDSLSEFVQDGQTAGKGLAKFSAMMNGAVDSLVAVNDYAIKSIEEAANKPTSALSIIWPFGAAPQTDEVIMQSFLKSMNAATKQIARLILEAEQIVFVLEKMEEQMVLLHEQLSREDTSISAAKSELLAELWTTLGGNKRKLRDHEQHLDLLRSLGTFRTHALAHVTVALRTLQSLSAELEELRDRVAMPGLVGDDIPVEVYVRAIRGGVERLQESKLKARQREAEIVRRVLDGIESS